MKYPYPDNWHPVRYVLYWEDERIVGALVAALQAARLRKQESEECTPSADQRPEN